MPGVSYKLRNKNAIDRRRWNITTQKRKVCDVEIKIISFVVNRSVCKVANLSQSTIVNLGKKQK